MSPETSFFPYFQPIISIASGRIVGYEALARQLDEDNHIVSAGHLFGKPQLQAEELREIDRQVRWLALQKFVRLYEHTYLAVNISAAWINSLPDLRDLPTLKMLDRLNIDRSRIIIELSEGEVNLAKLKEVVTIYKRDGLRVAIDNFGSDLLQLERIIAISPDIVKINIRLFKKAIKDRIVSDVVQLLTRFGSRLGSQIICQGVETDEEFLFGLNSGAQFFQGFLFSAAQPEFQPSHQYQPHAISLRQKFVNKKIVEEHIKIDRMNTVKAIVYRLKQELQNDFNLNTLLNWRFEEAGILRFYLCMNNGEQISPDFNFSDGKWFNDARKIGFNWSWRPYFYQVLALGKLADLDRIVVSDQYKDFDTGMLCQTLSLHLDEERILMVDMKTEC